MTKKTDTEKRALAEPPVPPISAGGTGDLPPSSGGGGQADIPTERPAAHRRGSKPGVKRGPYKRPAREIEHQAGELRSKSLAATIKTLHDLIAMVPGLECMAMDASEAKALGDAVKQWQEANPDSKVSPKVAAWLTMLSTLAVIYGPRGYMIYQTVKARAEERRRQAAPRAPVLKITPRPDAAPEHDQQAGDVEPGA